MLNNSEIQKIRNITKEVKKERLPLIFGALGDPTRLCIFKILLKYKNLCVTDISRICKLSVAAVSHQLKLLEMVGLVVKERDGKMICYEIKQDDGIVKLIAEIVINN